MRPPNLSGLLLGKVASNEIIDGQLDSFFWGDTDKLWQDARIQAFETFVFDDFSSAVDRVCVEDLTNASTALVLHSSFDKIDGVDHERSERACDAPQSKMMDRFENVVKISAGGRDGFIHGFANTNS